MGPVFGGPAYDAFGRAGPLSLHRAAHARPRRRAARRPRWRTAAAGRHELKSLAPSPQRNMTPAASAGQPPPRPSRRASPRRSLGGRFERVQTEEKSRRSRCTRRRPSGVGGERTPPRGAQERRRGPTAVAAAAAAAAAATDDDDDDDDDDGRGFDADRASRASEDFDAMEAMEAMEAELALSDPSGAGRKATPPPAIAWRELMRDSSILTVAATMLMVSLTVGALEPIVAYRPTARTGCTRGSRACCGASRCRSCMGSQRSSSTLRRSRAASGRGPERWWPSACPLRRRRAADRCRAAAARPSKLGVVLSTMGSHAGRASVASSRWRSRSSAPSPSTAETPSRR